MYFSNLSKEKILKDKDVEEEGGEKEINYNIGGGGIREGGEDGTSCSSEQEEEIFEKREN